MLVTNVMGGTMMEDTVSMYDEVGGAMKSVLL